MESAKLCCGSHLAAELKLQDDWGVIMRYAKRILVAAAIFSSYSAALAFDEKEIDRHHADSSGRSSSKKSTDNGAPAAKPNAPTASDSAAKARERLQQLSSGISTLTSNKDITITNSAGMNIVTFHGPLKINIVHRPNCE
jgi:hypothetical protein